MPDLVVIILLGCVLYALAALGWYGIMTLAHGKSNAAAVFYALIWPVTGSLSAGWLAIRLAARTTAHFQHCFEQLGGRR
jgi:hypothetical protein